MRSKTGIISLLLLAASCSALAQEESGQSIDRTISKYLEQINYLGELNKVPTDYDDSLIAANHRLIVYLQSACAGPLHTTTPLPKAEEGGLIINASSDGQLRYYAWDTWADQKSHFFDGLLQFNTPHGVKVAVLNNIDELNKRGDPGSYITEVATCQTTDGKTVYLPIECSIVSGNKGYGIRAIEIKNDTISPIPFFKTHKLKTSYIDFAFQEYYSGDTAGTGSLLTTLHFSADKKTLYVPEITLRGRLTTRYFIYKYNGDMFVYKRRGEDEEAERGVQEVK